MAYSTNDFVRRVFSTFTVHGQSNLTGSLYLALLLFFDFCALDRYELIIKYRLNLTSSKRCWPWLYPERYANFCKSARRKDAMWLLVNQPLL